MNPLSEQMLVEAERSALGLGLAGLKPLQKEALLHLAAGRSVFAGLPTGYGKSLCFWLPALAWGWRVWVVSPLISLIEDQTLACAKAGIPAIAWHGKMGPAQRREFEARMEAGEWRLCFLSPERLSAWHESGYLGKLRERGLDADLLVLDEMHCLEEWRSFRAAYRDLFQHVRKATETGSLLLGLSASLAAAESRAWMEELSAQAFASVGTELGRENLSLQVLAVEENARLPLLFSALRGLRPPESALVYCSTREECDSLSRVLRSGLIEAVAYHAGLPSLERSSRSLAFREGRLRVICATSAFGMGIDYPHVSRVLHFSVPRDLESYWQEVGRAGRSGLPAHALAFWRRSEIFRARQMKVEARKRYFALWSAWLGGGCRKRVIAERLGLECENCGKCDRCTGAGGGLLEFMPQAWWVEKAADPLGWLEEKLQQITKPW